MKKGMLLKGGTAQEWSKDLSLLLWAQLKNMPDSMGNIVAAAVGANASPSPLYQTHHLHFCWCDFLPAPPAGTRLACRFATRGVQPLLGESVRPSTLPRQHQCATPPQQAPHTPALPSAASAASRPWAREKVKVTSVALCQHVSIKLRES